MKNRQFSLSVIAFVCICVFVFISTILYFYFITEESNNINKIEQITEEVVVDKTTIDTVNEKYAECLYYVERLMQTYEVVEIKNTLLSLDMSVITTETVNFINITTNKLIDIMYQNEEVLNDNYSNLLKKEQKTKDLEIAIKEFEVYFFSELNYSKAFQTIEPYINHMNQ